MVFLDKAREEQPARTGKGFRPSMDQRPWGRGSWSQRMGAESVKSGGDLLDLRGQKVGNEGSVKGSHGLGSA